ncbi:unnamed protein product [Lepeophtheirus salmonis]|uniref:Outer dynein arm-docking complex subunit 4 n=1 Tax=Lepeophtheirus salmonis TaxID=72036 RepID=A0A7R8CPE6_LEPSM|nr:unnamed protein product [Lepeophtheirus salmonis]CAF2883223.1 unnamed protein product [Lepeophtheirus salmonis]
MWRKKVGEAIVSGNVFQFGNISKPMGKKEVIFHSSSSSSSSENSEDEDRQQRKSKEYEEDMETEGNNLEKLERKASGNLNKKKEQISLFPRFQRNWAFVMQWKGKKKKKVFNADGKRNNIVFGNDLLMDKKVGAYIDTSRAVDNALDIKSVMRKQRKNAKYKKSKGGVFIEEEESELCGIVPYIQRAKNQYNRGNFDSAISYLNAAIKFGTEELQRSQIKALENEDIIQARILRAKCYIKTGKTKESLKEAERILKAQKKNPEAVFIKAESYYFQSKFEKALLYYHQGNRLRTPLYTEKFRLGIAKAINAIMESISILDDPGTTIRKKDLTKSTFKSRVELVKKFNKFNRMDLDYSTSKNTIDFAGSVLAANEIKQKKIRNPCNEIEHDFLESICQAITPKEEEISEKDTRKSRYSKKKVKALPKPKSKLLEYTHETMGFIDKRKRFWASLSVNKNITTNVSKDHQHQN